MWLGLVSTASSSRYGRPDPSDDGGAPIESPRSRGLDIGMMGMLLLIASLAPLFISIAIWIIWLRFQHMTWPPPGSPPIPAGVWVSTALVLLLSGVMVWSLRALHRHDLPRLRQSLVVGIVLGFTFLLTQVLNWLYVHQLGVPDIGRQYMGLVGFFAVIHAAHVVGGIGGLFYIGVLAQLGRPLSRLSSPVRCTAVYWHFIDAVWVAALALVLYPG